MFRGLNTTAPTWPPPGYGKVPGAGVFWAPKRASTGLNPELETFGPGCSLQHARLSALAPVGLASSNVSTTNILPRWYAGDSKISGIQCFSHKSRPARPPTFVPSVLTPTQVAS